MSTDETNPVPNETQVATLTEKVNLLERRLETFEQQMRDASEHFSGADRDIKKLFSLFSKTDYLGVVFKQLKDLVHKHHPIPNVCPHCSKHVTGYGDTCGACGKPLPAEVRRYHPNDKRPGA